MKDRRINWGKIYDKFKNKHETKSNPSTTNEVKGGEIVKQLQKENAKQQSQETNKYKYIFLGSSSSRDTESKVVSVNSCVPPQTNEKNRRIRITVEGDDRIR